MRTLTLLAAAALLVTSRAPVGAAPSLTAPDTGLVDVPTAQVQGTLSLSAAAAWQDLAGGASALPVRVVVGLTGNTELGAAWSRVDFDRLDDNVVGFAAKHTLLRESSVVPGVAVGVRYGTLDNAPSSLLSGAASLGEGDLDATATSVYLVATKALKQPVLTSVPTLTGHLGVGWQHLKVSGRVGTVPVAVSETSNRTNLFAGLELTTARGTSLAVEYRTEPVAGSDPIVSGLLRYPLAAGLRVEAGWTNALPGISAAANEHNVFVGLSYSPSLR